jgi:hypothetical protein
MRWMLHNVPFMPCFWHHVIRSVFAEFAVDKICLSDFVWTSPQKLLLNSFFHSFSINHYDLCLISDMLYCVLSSGDVRVMSQQPLSSSSPTIRMPFTLTSHPTSMPASHHPAHRIQHHPTHYPLGSQSSGSEMSVGSIGRPPKPRKQRWVGK